MLRGSRCETSSCQMPWRQRTGWGLLAKRFRLLQCSRWLLGHFGQRDWKRAIICFLDGLLALVFGEFQVMRLPWPYRVILYALLLRHSVSVCFGSDLLPKLLNTCELSVVTLSAVTGPWMEWGKQNGLGSCSLIPQPHTKGHPCCAVVMGEEMEGHCKPTRGKDIVYNHPCVYMDLIMIECL